MKRSKSPKNALILLFTLLATLLQAQPDTTQRIPFEAKDNLETIRAKIAKNGYAFKVKDYGRTFPKAGRIALQKKQTLLTPANSPAETLILSAETLPEEFDWRDFNGKSYIGPIRNQGTLGTCYAFSACAAAEGAYNYAYNKAGIQTIDFSEAYIAFALSQIAPYSEHLFGEEGADYEYYELYGLTNPGAGTGYEGVCLEIDFPYTGAIPTQEQIQASYNANRIRFENWGRAFPTQYNQTTAAIKSAIITYGVVDAAVYVDTPFQAYASGVYEDTNTEPDATPYYYTTTNHGIALVGWDDTPPEGGGGCWILRNSWGPQWGENGYMRIRYYSAAVNAAAAYLYIPPQPSVASISTNYADRSGNINVTGQFKTHGQDAQYYFQYGTTTNYQNTTPPQPINSTELQNATGTIPNLTPGTYHWRAVLLLNGQHTPGENKTFTLQSPQATQHPTGYADPQTILLQGNAQIGDLKGYYYFRYGTTPQMTHTTPATWATGTTYATAKITNLPNETTLHYQLIVDNLYRETQTPIQTTTYRPAIPLYHEDFEGTWPGWTQQHLSGSPLHWQKNTGSARSTPDHAHQGTYNATLGQTGYYWAITRLDSPAINTQGYTQAIVTFWYAQSPYYANQDTLTLHYTTNQAIQWQTPQHFDHTIPISSWTQISHRIHLDGAHTFQIGLEGAYYGGLGNTLDTLTIYGLPPAPTSAPTWPLYN